MSSTRCSRLGAVLLVLALVASASAPAAAVTVEKDGVPENAEVGSQVSGTMTLTDLYGEYEKWTLQGSTELEGVTWTVTTYDQAGNQKAQTSYDGQSFNHTLALKSGVSKVDVKVTGTAPDVENFTYDPQQNFTFAELSKSRKGGTSDVFKTVAVDHYTQESQEARTAIEDAEQAISDADSAGASVSDQQSTLDAAIAAYNGDNFENAVTLADKAKKNADEAANKAESSAQQQKLLMYGGAAVLGLVVVGGAGYWYRSQQGPANKLQ